MKRISFTNTTLTFIGCALAFPGLLFSQQTPKERPPAPSLKKGGKQLFVDDCMIKMKRGVTRFVHPAQKLEKPVLEAEMPWEIKNTDGFLDKRVNIYGTVLRDEKTGTFRMWYADPGSVLYATSKDGVQWERPVLKITGKNNETDFHLHRWNLPPLCLATMRWMDGKDLPRASLMCSSFTAGMAAIGTAAQTAAR